MGERTTIETGTDDLLGWRQDGVAVLSFNRPERRNAFNDAIVGGFGRVLPELAVDESIGCVVVTGEGTAFCSGGDVKAFHERNQSAHVHGRFATAQARIDDLRRRQRLVSLALHQLPKITIAALPDAAAGAGLSIALACDLRIASDKAVLMSAFSRIGASGDFGTSWFLTQLVGPAKAKELMVLSERIAASEALQLGLVNRVVPHAGFPDAWWELARRVASGPTIAYRAVKENVNRATSCDLATALDAEAANMVPTMLSQDHFEATAAFVEKREPTFHGR